MDTMQADVIDVRADGRARARKVYSEAYKRRVVVQTFEPGVSVSQVAQRHGLNTNLLFTWRRQPGYAPSSAPGATAPKLLPVTVSAPKAESKVEPAQADVNQGYIEIQIGAACMRLHGAVDMQTVAGVVRMLERGR
jgi:transposase